MDLAARRQIPVVEIWSGWRSLPPESLIFETLAGTFAPGLWLSLARHSPTLARCIRDAIQSSRPTCEAWWHAFVHRPPWRELARKLADQSIGSDEDAKLQTAHLAVSLAREHGASHSDAFFWHCLLGTASSPTKEQDFDAVGTARDLLTVARLEVRLADERLIADGNKAQLRLNRTFSHGHLQGLAGWLQEAKLALRLDCWDWRGPIRDRLLASAAMACCAQVEAEQPQRDALLRARTSREVSLAVAAWLAPKFLDAFAVWFGNGLGGHGVIRTILGLGLHEFSGTVDGFEWTLPANLRSSQSWNATGNEIACRVFAGADDAALLPSVSNAIELALESSASNCKISTVEASLNIESETESSEQRFAEMVAEFAAGAGHEINNPLATIRGKTDLLLRKEVDPAARLALLKIQDQVARIRTMIRDLRRLGTGDTAPFTTVDLTAILEKAIVAAGAESPDVEVELPPTEMLTLRSDAELIERMIAELIRNGAKAAGPGGSVRVKATAIENRVCLEIFDTGPGFSDEVRRKAFGPFFSGRSAGRGLGMGLAVVRQIVDLHGGTLSLSFGRPTSVTVSLPLEKPT